MNLNEGLVKLVSWIYENWAFIFALVVICIGAYMKYKDFKNKTKEEQEALIQQAVEIAKAQIKEIMLRWVTEAEKDYYEWLKSGAVKRAQVIDRVFQQYPILSKVTDQAKLIKWLDETIDEALVTMREFFKENEKKSVNGKFVRKTIQESEAAGG